MGLRRSLCKDHPRQPVAYASKIQRTRSCCGYIMSNQVAVVAVTRNQENQIHRWIHHHLFFGFKEVNIAVHSSTDSTRQVISKISNEYPCVKLFVVDWLHQGVLPEKNPQVDSHAYAYITDYTRRHHPNITHTLYSCVDEFWYPDRIEGGISSFVSQYSSFDALKLPVLGHSDPYAPISIYFKKAGKLLDMYRSIVSLNSVERISEFGKQMPKFNDNAIVEQASTLLPENNDSAQDGSYILKFNEQEKQLQLKNDAHQSKSGIFSKMIREVNSRYRAYERLRNDYQESLREFELRCEIVNKA